MDFWYKVLQTIKHFELLHFRVVKDILSAWAGATSYPAPATTATSPRSASTTASVSGLISRFSPTRSLRSLPIENLDNLARAPRDDQVNLPDFIGYLVATGVAGGGFDIFALLVLRDTLEEPWKGATSDSHTRLQVLFVFANQVISQGRHGLAGLCNRSAPVVVPPTPRRGATLDTKVGQLAVQAGLDPGTEGFSPER